MSTFIGICIAILLLAVAFLFTMSGLESGSLIEAFRVQAVPQRAAWVLIAAAVVGLAGATVWQSHLLALQRRATRAYERRFGEINQLLDGLADGQQRTEQAVQHLARTDPEEAVAALQQRVAEAEQRTLVQQGRNQAADMQQRVEWVRQRQQALRDRIADVIERRKLIDETFTELSHRQYLVERSLADIERKDDAPEIEGRIGTYLEFVKLTHGRFDEIERLAARAAALKSEFDAIQVRLAPLEAQKGMTSAIAAQLDDIRGHLLANIERLEQDGDRGIAERIQEFSDGRQQLEQRLVSLSEQFEKLDVIRRDIGAMLRQLNGSLGERGVTGA